MASATAGSSPAASANWRWANHSNLGDPAAGREQDRHLVERGRQDGTEADVLAQPLRRVGHAGAAQVRLERAPQAGRGAVLVVRPEWRRRSLAARASCHRGAAAQTGGRSRRHGRVAAIDDQFGGGDITGFVGGEEEDGVGNIPGVAHPAHRHPGVAGGNQAFHVTTGDLPRQAGLDERRVHETALITGIIGSRPWR